MLEQMSQDAKQALRYAQEAARRWSDGFVSTQHLLLGVLRDENGPAVKVLQRCGVSVADVMTEIEKRLPKGESYPDQELPMTPRGKRVLDYAFDEMVGVGASVVGTEHILLGLLREGEGLASVILTHIGVTLDSARNAVADLQQRSGGRTSVTGVSPRSSVRGNSMGLQGLSLTSIAELTPVQALEILNIALAMKVERLRGGELVKFKKPKTLAMIFEKPSLRTRVTFETGMFQLGGQAIFLGPNDIKMGERETPGDVAANLSRWVDGVMARVFRHDTLLALDECSSVPIINGLSDLEHPCQALADFMTFYEYKHGFEGKKLAWVGDGNNVLHSNLLLASLVGLNISVACPDGYGPSDEIVDTAQEFAEASGSVISFTNDPAEAVKDADAIYTDVWASMGHEAEKEQRRTVFAPFQVNAELLKKARPDAIVLHCLPAVRGEEITDEVLDGPQSAVLDQAENRLHAQKALLAVLLGES